MFASIGTNIDTELKDELSSMFRSFSLVVVVVDVLIYIYGLTLSPLCLTIYYSIKYFYVLMALNLTLPLAYKPRR